jgi:hypothetical protein
VPGSIGSSPLAAGAVSTNVAVQQPSTSWVNFPAGNFSGYTFYQLINTSFSLDQASYVTILFFAGTTPYFNPTGNAVSPNLQIVQVDGSYVIGAPIPSNPTFYGAPCVGGASTIQVFLGAGTHTLIWWVQPLGMGSSIYDIVYGTNCTVIALKR